MVRKKQASPFTGLWHIVSMETWDGDYFHEEIQAFNAAPGERPA